MPTVFWLRCLVDRELRNQQDAKCSGCSVNAHRQHRTTNYYPNNSCQTHYTEGPDKRVGWHCRTSKAIQFHRRDSLNVWLSLPVVNRCSVNQPFSKTFHRLTQHKIVFTEKTTSCECIRCNQPPIRILYTCLWVNICDSVINKPNEASKQYNFPTRANRVIETRSRLGANQNRIYGQNQPKNPHTQHTYTNTKTATGRYKLQRSDFNRNQF